LNRWVAVEVLEFLVDQIQIEILLVPGHLELLDGATHPHRFALRQTRGDIGSDDKDGVLSDVVTANGQRMRCDDRSYLTGQMNLLSDPPLEALLGGAPFALFPKPGCSATAGGGLTTPGSPAVSSLAQAAIEKATTPVA
jgi:hypothetical protein